MTRNNSKSNANQLKNEALSNENESFTTELLHSSFAQLDSNRGIHSAIQHSVNYSYETAEDLIDAFQGKRKSFTYARSNSPTVQVLEKRINALENGTETLCLSTGMAAILLPLLALVQKGDHILASKYIFGNTVGLFKTLKRIGLDIDFVDISEVRFVEEKLKATTRIIFFETISNPLTYIPDLENIQQLAQAHKLITIVDNTLTTPYLFKPKALGFSIAHHSLTKYIGGHAAALGGSLTDLGNEDWHQHPNILPAYKENIEHTQAPSLLLQQLRKQGMRDMGSTLNPHGAATIALGMETLALRMKQICNNGEAIAKFLDNHSKVATVYHPSLPSHPHHTRMKKWFLGGSGVLAFELKPEYDFLKLLNSLKIFILATHLGDTRSLAIPMAPTIFFERGTTERKALGIAENLIRLSVGIEETASLLADLGQALDSL